MAAALAAGLADGNNLVARGVLELLATYFPIHAVYVHLLPIHVV